MFLCDHTLLSLANNAKNVLNCLAGRKCNSNIRDDVLLLPLCGGVLLPAQIPPPFW